MDLSMNAGSGLALAEGGALARHSSTSPLSVGGRDGWGRSSSG